MSKPTKKLATKTHLIIEDGNKLYGVDKEFFSIQFNAKEKEISRLKNSGIDLQTNIDKYDRKYTNLKTLSKNEYKTLKNILEDKDNYAKTLKAEISNLQQEADSMVETGKKILKEKDDEFMIIAGKIKSTTAVFVGRLNKLEEFFKQENELEQKCAVMKNEIVASNEQYEKLLKRNEEKYYHTKKVIQTEMLKRCVNFGVHLKKQSMRDMDPVIASNVSDTHDIKDKLRTAKTQKEILEKQFLDIKKEDKYLASLSKSNQKTINENLDAYLKTKCKIKSLDKELTELLVDLKNFQEHINKEESQTSKSNKLSDIVNSTEQKLQALSRDVSAAQTELSNIRIVNDKLDNFIWKMEDLLLEAVEHAEEIKSNTTDYEEKMLEFIQDMHKQLKSFIRSEELALCLND